MGFCGVEDLRLDLALSESLAEAEKVDLGLDCARKESGFWVDVLGAMVAVWMHVVLREFLSRKYVSYRASNRSRMIVWMISSLIESKVKDGDEQTSTLTAVGSCAAE